MTKDEVSVGMRVRLKENAPVFAGKFARIAYIGNVGVSVYLEDDVVDDCLAFNYKEIERG